MTDQNEFKCPCCEVTYAIEVLDDYPGPPIVCPFCGWNHDEGVLINTEDEDE